MRYTEHVSYKFKIDMRKQSTNDINRQAPSNDVPFYLNARQPFSYALRCLPCLPIYPAICPSKLEPA